ncbi:glycoside hydrolase family 3 N-terminal domain-containing protein [Rhodovulum visakhapatnamense]|uniref:beta-glucosidase n=1 Tax=Rhodovulum visakhapatnamense TaxID=364297 RepID=A0A4R8FQ51_9RHOB|nr:glycoside hydrolase family 3 N-terminal domain-containing protein [Rhodovulum visakhapatnamense]TDX28581.1 beta-glucosidase [Rhodovulum visakhapatnamense]
MDRRRGGETVDRLMAQMTLAEKIGQLNLLAAGEGLVTGAATATPLAKRLDAGQVGAIFGTKSLASARDLQDRALAGSRLKIPLFFAEDVIHGHRTVFPLPIALAASWDMALIEATAGFAAAEASAEGLHQVYAPMIDVSRDARWGRMAESPGEDPHLAGAIAAAMTRGLQGDDPASPGRVAACLKHFVAYGAPLSGRDYDNASLAWEDLLETYLPPFAQGVAAGAASVMAAFNAVNKLPMHAHEPLIEGWLRGTTGFDGLVVSDYTGIRELTAHGLGSPATVVLRALAAGIDMDMVGEDYLAHLPALAEAGLDAPEAGLSVPAERVRALIDRACARVLGFKARLGLLDDPWRGLTGSPPAPDRAEGRALARKAAARSAVLLKNDGLLPHDPAARVALIGPLARDRANMLGTWSVSGRAADVTPLFEAMTAIAGRPPAHAPGCNLIEEDWLVDRLNVHGVTVTRDPRPEAEMLAEAVAVAQTADVVVVALGEAKEHAGESSSRLCPDLPAPQRRLLDALAATGTPLVVAVFAGRALALGGVDGRCGALLYAWHGGIAGPEGVADLIFGRAEPSGRLPVTLPAAPGQTPVSHAEDPTGRPWTGRFVKFRTGWLDLPGDRQPYPFGFGLSYTEVDYAPPRLSAAEAGPEDRVRLSVTLTNTGPRPATETVQVYLSDPEARITRPARHLVAFRHVDLAPGATREVVFEIGADLARYPLAPSLETARWVRDPGRIVLHVGPNSRDTRPVELTWRA